MRFDTRNVFLVIALAMACSVQLNSCASVFPTHALPTNDFLTLWEVHDTSYCAARSIGAPPSMLFYRERDSAFHAVAIAPAYAAPLYDLDSNRALDSANELSPSRWTRLKNSTADTYTILIRPTGIMSLNFSMNFCLSKRDKKPPFGTRAISSIAA